MPRFAVLIASTMLTRIPYAINGLAVILFLRAETGSFATAGLAAGGLALGAGIAAPLVGRLVDRRGAVLLMPVAVGHAAAIISLWVLASPMRRPRSWWPAQPWPAFAYPPPARF